MIQKSLKGDDGLKNYLELLRKKDDFYFLDEKDLLAKKQKEENDRREKKIKQEFLRNGLFDYLEDLKKKRDLKKLLEYPRLDWSEKPYNYLVMGSFGVGKTFAVMVNILEGMEEKKLHSFRYISSSQIFDMKYNDYQNYSELKDEPLLVVDEFLGSKTRKDLKEVMQELIDYRTMRFTSTIFITSETLKSAKYLLSEATLSRLKEFQLLGLYGSDLRQEKNSLE